MPPNPPCGQDKGHDEQRFGNGDGDLKFGDPLHAGQLEHGDDRDHGEGCKMLIQFRPYSARILAEGERSNRHGGGETGNE